MIRILFISLALILPWSAGAQQVSEVVPPEVTAFAKPFENRLENITVYEGDFTGDGQSDALVFFFVVPPTGGNLVLNVTELFSRVDGTLQHAGTVEGMVGYPKRVHSWQPGRIEMVMTKLLPNEPRCCPTGEQIYSIIPPG